MALVLDWGSAGLETGAQLCAQIRGTAGAAILRVDGGLGGGSGNGLGTAVGSGRMLSLIHI